MVNLIECEVQARSGVITITNSVELKAGIQFQYSLIDAVDNPVSSQPTDSFTILTSVGETETEDIILTTTPGYMLSYSLTPQSKIVGESTTLEVRWRGQHTIPKGSYIFMDFPKWNPENPLR